MAIPFSSLSDIEFEGLLADVSDNLIDIYEICSDLNIKAFDVCNYVSSTDHECSHHSECDCDRDADINFYNNIKIDSPYYTTNQFIKQTSTISKNRKKLSIIHFNARSLNQNYEKIESYLSELNYHFEIIAISETWTTPNNEDFALPGYTSYFVSRNSKKGGGVALFIDDSIKQKKINNLSKKIDNCFESLFIEISLETKKKFTSDVYYIKRLILKFTHLTMKSKPF